MHNDLGTCDGDQSVRRTCGTWYSEGQSVLGEGLDGATCKQIRVLQCVSGE